MNNDTGGTYQLLIKLKENATLQIGKLGRFYFPAGYYIYTGRAIRFLEQRIARHCRSKKKNRWHIDYLLRAARVVGVYIIEDTICECWINRATKDALPSAAFPAKGFGSSDCKCFSHLIYAGVQTYKAYNGYFEKFKIFS